MDIDVMDWIRKNLKPHPVAPEKALPGRDTPILNPIPIHQVLGLPLDAEPEGSQVAYFALGCYWGAEKLFWQQPGVLNTAVGFMGGYTPNPTYQECCSGSTGHTETVKVVFDPAKTSYSELLKTFWENHDPTTANRQGNDIGTQYRSAIFPVNEAQLAAAKASAERYQAQLTKAGFDQISTEITPDQQFFYAEAEHQQYLAKNPDGYCPVHATGVSCG